MASTIAVAGLKGGIGKSAILGMVACHLASTHRILIADCDGQPSTTAFILNPSVARGLDPDCTIASVHAGDDPYPEQVIRPTEFGVDLLPGSRAAARFNLPEPQTAPVEAQLRLRTFLAEIDARYDFILIDTAPSLGMTTWAALVAADYYFVPSQVESYSTITVADVFESANLVTAGPNPGLALLGIVVSMINRRRAIHQLYESQIRSAYGDKVFAATVPYLNDFPEAIGRGKPVTQYKPRGAAAKAIKAVTAEMLTRIASIESGSLVEEA